VPNNSSNGTTKRTRTSASRTRRKRTSQSVVTAVAPLAVERMIDALVRMICTVDHFDGREGLRDHEEVVRHRSGEYIAALAEQRPDENKLGYFDGYPIGDQAFRLFWSGITRYGEFWRDKSKVLPDWMALPLIRRIMLDSKAKKAFTNEPDETDETDRGKVDPA
jgi:hypothetical protein